MSTLIFDYYRYPYTQGDLQPGISGQNESANYLQENVRSLWK